MEILKALPDDAFIGVGVVNQKHGATESVDFVSEKIKQAANIFGQGRVLLHPDCGFATFADNPICGAESAEAKLAVIAKAARTLREAAAAV
jgi:5-methyltetrahydropteroyltriglutamate--homocysteine methyltransferase